MVYRYNIDYQNTYISRNKMEISRYLFFLPAHALTVTKFKLYSILMFFIYT